MSKEASIVNELWTRWCTYKFALLGQGSTEKTIKVSDRSVRVVRFINSTTKRMHIKVCIRQKFLCFQGWKQVLLFSTWMHNYSNVNGPQDERRFEILFIDPSKSEELAQAVFLLKRKTEAIEDSLGAADELDDL